MLYYLDEAGAIFSRLKMQHDRVVTLKICETVFLTPVKVNDILQIVDSSISEIIL